MKRTGLADSPFFATLQPGETVNPSPNNQAQSQTPGPHTVTPANQNTGEPVSRHTGLPSHRHTSVIAREKKKHGFVVFKDQVTSLEQIVIALWQRAGEKPEVGEIVREGLDYIIGKKKRELDL